MNLINFLVFLTFTFGFIALVIFLAWRDDRKQYEILKQMNQANIEFGIKVIDKLNRQNETFSKIEKRLKKIEKRLDKNGSKV